MRIYGQENVLIYRTNRKFWEFYQALPEKIQKRADEKFELLKQDSTHPSLRLKKVGPDWVVRINKNYRTLATEEDGSLVLDWET